MKKLIHIFLFATLITVSACTEEDVKPQSENGGGREIDPIIR